MTDAPISKLQARLAAAKAQKLAEEASKTAPEPAGAPEQAYERYSHLAPEPDFEPDPWAEMLNGISILDAYARWCGKMKPTVRPGQRESILISCPKPTHRDANPSAWVNLDLNTWYCAGCQQGGDIYDIAAFRFGYSVPDYKSGKDFGKLRREMATDLGYTVVKDGKKDKPIRLETPAPAVTNVIDLSAKRAENQTPSLTPAVAVAAQPPEPELTDEELNAILVELGDDSTIFPTLDWKKVVTPGTFLDEYMHSTIVTSSPEEYHFWNAIMALGMAVGRNVYLPDDHDVYANIFICLLGGTGDGKTRSTRHVSQLLARALPYDPSRFIPEGVYVMPQPSSAEALVDSFIHEYPDPTDTNPKPRMLSAPVNGFVQWGEMSELIAFAGRKGNPLKNILMSLYDAEKVVSINSRAKMARAVEPFCSVVTTAQPNTLKTILTQGDKQSGFLNRWVFASGKAKKRKFFQTELVDLNRSTALLREIHDWGTHKRIPVTRDPDADDILERFFSETLDPVIRRDETGVYGRVELLYKKLLLLFCINEQTSIVTPEIAEKVISMHQYTTESYDIPRDKIGNDELTTVYMELGELIRDFARKSNQGAAYSYLKTRLIKRGHSIGLIDRAFKIMEERGEITYADGKTGNGRLVRKYSWIGA